MSDNGDFTVRFWGVRGSIACPGPDHQRYGGNTSCLEVRCGEHLLIFDAGSGLRLLGNRLAAEGVDQADLFLTHTHFDHIMGLPFFRPMFNPQARVRVWSGHLQPGSTLHDALCQFMAAPLFPVPPDIFAAKVSYHDFAAGETLEPKPGVRLRTAALNHPNGATGYRIDYGGHAICYVTDTEHVEGQRDETVMELVRGADLLIYDSSFTDEEYACFKGWGHSTWQEGVRICEAADVKRLAIFHHDPLHDDKILDAIAKEADRARPGTLVAAEGMVMAP